MTTEQVAPTPTDLPFRDPRNSSEAWARDQAVEFGIAFGNACPNIWAPIEEWYPAIHRTALSQARSLVQRISTETRQWVFYLSLTAAFGGVLLLFIFLTRGTPSALDFAVAWFLWTLLWLAAYIVGRFRHRRVVRIRQERFEWLTEVIWTMATTQILRMRSAAAQYQPGAGTSFQPTTEPPAPTQFGASDVGALHLAAAWMRYLGEIDAQPLGGQWTGSLHYLAGVFNSAAELGEAELHALVGFAVADGRRPLAFTAGPASQSAIVYADRVGLPLFEYSAVGGTLAGRSQAAVDQLKTGL